MKNFIQHLALSHFFYIYCLAGVLFAANTASRHGVIWNFDRNYVTGTYINGDPWVVGPVTIISISPTPSDGQNGAMLNPNIGTTQGFDKDFIAGYNDYISSFNVGKSMPLTIAPDSSLVSSITEAGWTSFHTIRNFSVLTVVRSAPNTGSFRPPVIGAGSRDSLWNESQINYGRLASLPRASLSVIPNISDYEIWFSFPWIELNPNWTGGYLRPSYMAKNGYGREIAYRTGDAALLCNLDFTPAQKRNLLIGLIQVGIDNYGFISKGGTWYNDGGHNIGRLAPVMIAAGVLNDDRLKQVIKGSSLKFQEYQSTFIVLPSDTTRKLGVWDHSLQRLAGTNGDPIFPYLTSDIGMAEWGIRHTGTPELDNNYIKAAYREINGSTHTAPTMVARVMGLRAVIDWEPLFRYAERHLGYEQSAAYKGEWNYGLTPVFHKQFFNVFKNYVPGTIPDVTTPPLPPAIYKVGDRIQLTAITNVRSSGVLTATLLGTQPLNAAGKLLNGPTIKDSNNIVWWQVDFDSGVDGWCGQDNFIQTNTQPPVKPVTFKPGNRIKVSANTNIRLSGALDATLLGVQPVNSEGTLREGPTELDENNIIWWRVDYDSGVDGWCGQDHFIQVFTEPPVAPTEFKIGDRIQVSDNTNVRISGALGAELLGVQYTGAKGTLRGGPTPKDENNIIWWQVDYDNGTDGWCGQDHFTPISADPPQPPTGLRVEP